MTGKVKGLVVSMALLVIALLMIPLVMDSVHTAVTDTRTQTFNGCVVAATATTVTLTDDPLNNSTDWVTSVTSATEGVTPTITSYNGGTNALVLGSLGATTPQNITVTYDYEVNGEYAGVNSITNLVPMLVVVGLILVAIINGIWTMKKD